MVLLREVLRALLQNCDEAEKAAICMLFNKRKHKQEREITEEFKQICCRLVESEREQRSICDYDY